MTTTLAKQYLEFLQWHAMEFENYLKSNKRDLREWRTRLNLIQSTMQEMRWWLDTYGDQVIRDDYADIREFYHDLEVQKQIDAL